MGKEKKEGKGGPPRGPPRGGQGQGRGGPPRGGPTIKPYFPRQSGRGMPPRGGQGRGGGQRPIIQLAVMPKGGGPPRGPPNGGHRKK